MIIYFVQGRVLKLMTVTYLMALHWFPNERTEKIEKLLSSTAGRSQTGELLYHVLMKELSKTMKMRKTDVK